MDYWRPLCMPVPLSLGGAHLDDGIIAPVAGMAGACYGVVTRYRRLEGGGVLEEDFALEDVAVEFEEVRRIIGALRDPVAGLALDRPRIMGIVNVTPDSFYDGGHHDRVEAAVAHGVSLFKEGADILDVGGESTRPGAETVSIAEELARVIPVIEGLCAKTTAVISIDSRKAEVMEAALNAGASMINDVSALTYDERSLAVVVSANVPVVLMHAQGGPEDMQDNPSYDHVLLDVYDYLQERMAFAVAGGVKASNIILDPGIGFGKTLAHNGELLNGLSIYHGLGAPLLLGCSRKRFIGDCSANEPASARLPGSLAGVLKGASQGVQIFRVHDVAETRQALAVWFHGLDYSL